MINNLSDFITEIVEIVQREFKRDTEILLINDIIDIYNKKYDKYLDYRHFIYYDNEYIKKWNELYTAKPNTSILRFKPEHHIITAELFSYILELRKRYEENK